MSPPAIPAWAADSITRSHRGGCVSLVPANFSLAVGSTTAAAGRSSNEDAILVKPIALPAPDGGAGYLLAVADGMGGYERGEQASQLAIEFLAELFDRDAPADVALGLKQAYRRANDAIFKQSQDGSEPGPMGTTLVSAVVRGKYVTIANIGDSRAYLLRAKQLTQITQDHSLVAEQVAQGTLSEQEARTSPQRNIVTQALGVAEKLESRMPSIYEISLLPEDRLLLCSDGFFDVLQADDYVSTMLARNPQDSALALVETAVARGTTDNVSAVILEVSPSLATVQRTALETELAANAPRFGQMSIAIMFLLVVVVLIVAATVVYLGFM
jgi:serine/threonine protein phosphatase PrpC